MTADECDFWQAMANLLRVRTVVQQTLARQDAERTNQFLHAASSGDVAKIRQVSRCWISAYVMGCQKGPFSASVCHIVSTLALACKVMCESSFKEGTDATSQQHCCCLL